MSSLQALPRCLSFGLVLVHATFALSGCAPSIKKPVGDASRISTWVWDRDTALRPEAQRSLLDFSRTRNVGTLFVQASSGYDAGGEFDAFARLADGAAQQAVAVVLVGGDPSWALAAHHADAVAFLRLAERVDDRLGQRRLPVPRRVLFDVEPYLLEEWKTSPEVVEKQYVALLETLRAASRSAEIEVWHTIPFWLSDRTVEGRSLDRTVLDRSDGVVVMAYRNSVTDVVSVATGTLQHAAEVRKPVVVAIETKCVEPSYVSFCGASSASFEETLPRLTSSLRRFPSFAGVAVHHYPSWRALADESK